MIELALSAFVTLFVVLDPPGIGPMFAALSEGENEPYKRRLAIRGSLIAMIILVGFAFVGEWVLRMLGVTINSFRIAGGLLLFLVAVDMLFAHETPLRRTTPDETQEAIRRHDISVFPLAIPLIAGPGAMTTVVLLMQQAEGDIARQALVLAILAVVMVLVWLALVTSARLVKLIGVTGTNVITRVLGVILGALAVQYVVDGLLGAFGKAT
jgi:multiple antibiotic resistance protein